MDTAPPQTPFELLASKPDLIRFHLVVNDPVISDPPLLTDFVEATFPGYVPKAGRAWTQNQAGLSTEVCQRGTSVVWTMAEAAPAQTVYGWYATWEKTPGVQSLFFVERLRSPQTLQRAKQTLLVKMLFAMKRTV